MKNPMVSHAIADMQAFHAGQLDKSGVAYHWHPYRVMLRLGSLAATQEQIAALLHDVVEDTKIGFVDLCEMGYDHEALEMVHLLTKRKSMTHRQYLQIIIDSGSIGAMRVKLADLYDNSWERRVANAPEEVRISLKKMIESRYKPSIMLMKEALGANADGIIEGDIEILEIKDYAY